MAEFPDIKSKHSLVAKHVTKEKWDKLSGIVSKTSGFTLAKAIACAVQFDNQVGIHFLFFVAILLHRYPPNRHRVAGVFFLHDTKTGKNASN
jgi:hypothetical protein